MNVDLSRRYEITSVLGQGGYGTVYRATLKGAGGFAKDVAIKLLKDPSPPPEVLQRFRDEARVLGLIRDRAVVHVEAPVKLADRWAVIMEYVDGASLSRILRTGGPVAPEVGLAITAEIAAALHRLWNQAGPNDAPLNLRHRDLKPGNVQVRPDGSLVLLDFGVAKATFDSREAHTSTGVLGTEGYIAPERFFGTDGATTDVFSLGVMLHEMLTGRKPTPLDGRKDAVRGQSLHDEALELARLMVTVDPAERPEPVDVEETCLELLRAWAPQSQNPRECLRAWAATAVPAASRLPNDALVGEVLTESQTMAQASRAAPVGLALLAGGTTVAVTVALFAFAVVALAVALVLVLREPAQVAALPPPPSPAPAAPAAAPPPAPAASAPAPAAPVASAPVAPAPPAPARAPDPRPAAPGRPAPAEPAPTEVAPVSAATRPVTFGSLPTDATVAVDGQVVGTTPLVGYALADGTHTVTLTLDGKSVTKSVVVDRRAPGRYLWRVDTGAWEASR